MLISVTKGTISSDTQIKLNRKHFCGLRIIILSQFNCKKKHFLFVFVRIPGERYIAVLGQDTLSSA